jgi:hypothetical protein
MTAVSFPAFRRVHALAADVNVAGNLGAPDTNANPSCRKASGRSGKLTSLQTPQAEQSRFPTQSLSMFRLDPAVVNRRR